MEISEELIKEQLSRKFIGARGINDWLLYSSMEPGKTDPLDPDNVIIFGAGLLAGTAMPAAVAISPQSLEMLIICGARPH